MTKLEFMKLWDYSQPQETREKFKALHEDSKETADTDSLLSLQTQIARTHSLVGEFDEAHKLLDQIEKDLKENDKEAHIRYQLERGRCYRSNGEVETSKPYFSKAWELSKRDGFDTLAVDAAHMIAIVEKDFDEEMNWNLKALALAESSNEPSAQNWRGSLYNNIGWTYYDNGSLEKALKLFKKAAQFHEEKQNKQSHHIAKWTVGHCLRSLNKNSEALEIQLELYKNNPEDGYVCEEIGELYLSIDQKEKSKPFFKQAFDALSKDQWLQNNQEDRLKRLEELGAS